MLPVVTQTTDRCRRCYSCVRGCPAKAIRVREGQAQVLQERCVSCGRCVKMCSQRVKQIANTVAGVKQVLTLGNAVVMLAPSFPAAFTETSAPMLVAGLRELGFKGVYEVGFGADLVSRRYADLWKREPEKLHLTTPCPACVSYIRKYAPELVGSLTPIMSPMVAMGKLIKERLRPGARVVFVGPCAAKMREMEDPDAAHWVDVVTTFHEIAELLTEARIDILSRQELSDFDPPHASHGNLYPLAGALLEVAKMPHSLTQTAVTHVCGSKDFATLIDRLREDVRSNMQLSMETRFFDVLFCKGCIDGPTMGSTDELLRRKNQIVSYVRSRQKNFDQTAWEKALVACDDLDLSRTFESERVEERVPTDLEIREILRRTNKHTPEAELNCQACGYRSCRDKATAVARGLAEIDMCLPYMIERLEATISSLHQSHEELTETQAQLVRSERLASMGQMAAGIAHEINNPLGTILLYAHLLKETDDCPDSLKKDADMILAEASRCRNIVGGLLNFARQNKVRLSRVLFKTLFEEALEVVQPLAKGPHEWAITLKDETLSAVVDREQIHQVLVNLLRNAAEACQECPDRHHRIEVSGAWDAPRSEFRIAITDSGPGIPEEILPKLFSPFFSTKPVGKGTGLGLPICYGIAKMHRGRIDVRNNEGTFGASFSLIFPDLSRQGEDTP